MPQNRVSTALALATLALLPLQLVSEAQGQSPGTGASAPAAAPGPPGSGPGGRGGRGLGGGRGFGPTMNPSALRAIPAETTAARVEDPNWKAPRTAWGHPDLEGVWTSDDMRRIPTSRPAAQAAREFLTPEEFAHRAGGDESSRDRAVNQETFLEVYSGAPVEGVQPVRELGGGKEE